MSPAVDLAGVKLAPGARLGRYELVAPVGRGGMAVVWAARLVGSHRFSKLVAVKTMLPALAADPRFSQMFLDEATVSSSIEHPNVCAVLDLGDVDGQLYLVMEWVHGDTLAALEAESDAPVPIAVAGRIALDVARGLHAAHEATDPTGASLGLVHRDVSPQNVLVGLDGRSRIADFGVAKREGGAATAAGYVKGKVRYMAPEQVYSEAVDRRTDVFALGVVLYEATTGRHPFAGPTDVATLSNVAGPEEAAHPSAVLPGYPAALASVVQRAVAKDPAVRFATAAELADALEAALGDESARHPDVAAWVERVGGDRIAARQRAIRAAHFERPASDPGGAPPSLQEAAPGRRRSRGAAGAAIVGALVLALVLAAGVSSRAPARPAAAADEPAPPRSTAAVEEDRPARASTATPAATLDPPAATASVPASSPRSRAPVASGKASAVAPASPVAASASAPKPDVLETRE